MRHSEIGRILFPGNPWPNGHGISAFAWSARLTLSGVYFDFHLESAAYDEEGPGDVAGGEASVWTNYHSCTLSSVKWASQLDGEPGFLVGTVEEPLSFTELAGRTFRFDPPTENDEVAEERGFGIYLIGHDAPADHVVRFGTWAEDGSIDIHWSGWIAHTYSGSRDLTDTFDATIHNARFGGIAVEKDVSPAEARASVRRFVVDAARLKLMHGKKSGARRFVLVN